MKRPAGVSRWVNEHGKISLAGFSYHVGAAYVSEPVEVVVSRGLVDILHARVLVAPTPSGCATTRPTGGPGRRRPAVRGTRPRGHREPAR